MRPFSCLGNEAGSGANHRAISPQPISILSLFSILCIILQADCLNSTT